MIHNFYGKLTLKNFKVGIKDNYEYVLCNRLGLRQHNISKILNEKYYSDDCQIGFVINYNDVDRFNEVGELYKDKDRFGVYDYSINGMGLGLILHNLVGKDINIIIDDFIEVKNKNGGNLNGKNL